MNKEKFILKLSQRLKDLDDEDTIKACEFYSEMISDRMEEGLKEEEAVEALGSIDFIESEIRGAIRNDSELPIIDSNEELKPMEPSKMKQELKGYQLALLILGFPLWFPLIITALSVALALYVVIWGVVASSYIANVALGISGISLLVAGFGFLFTANLSPAILSIGEALLAIGLAVLLFIGLKYITRLGIKLTKELTVLLRGILFGGKKNA